MLLDTILFMVYFLVGAVISLIYTPLVGEELFSGFFWFLALVAPVILLFMNVSRRIDFRGFLLMLGLVLVPVVMHIFSLLLALGGWQSLADWVFYLRFWAMLFLGLVGLFLVEYFWAPVQYRHMEPNPMRAKDQDSP